MPPEIMSSNLLQIGALGPRHRTPSSSTKSTTTVVDDYHNHAVKTSNSSERRNSLPGMMGSETDLLLYSNLQDDTATRTGNNNNINHETDNVNAVMYASIPKTAMTQQQKILALGVDISHLSRKWQFLTCAGGVFGFSLLYGYLQELISVTLCNRQLGLYIAMMQFMGYAIWSRILNSHIEKKNRSEQDYYANAAAAQVSRKEVPIRYYILLAILRAIDASMTNMAMAYLNYPAKTLMKSSRVVFTMLFGTLVGRKRYKLMDYLVVMLMVSGLVIFMHADAKSSAVFQPLGIVMLTTSLMCDGAINNMSERIMNQYNVGQDEFIYKLYSIALVGITAGAIVRGDLWEGTRYLLTPGTYGEILEGREATWSVGGKFFAIVLFSSTGFFGSSCSALITKEFGALTMSITSTARKATTLFLSFALFNNVCTMEHIGGIVLFIVALVVKSFRASRKGHGGGDYNSSSSSSDNKGNDGAATVNGYIEVSSGTKGHYMEMETTNGISSSISRDRELKRRTNRHAADIV